MEFRDKLKKIRREKNLTQEELSKKANLAIGTIRQFETGKRNPSYKSIQQLSEALNVDSNVFFSDETHIDFSPTEAHDIIEQTKDHLAAMQAALEREDLIAAVNAARESSELAPIQNALLVDLKQKIIDLFSSYIDFSDPVAITNYNSLIKSFSSLNDLGQKKTIEYSEDLLQIKEYQKDQ